MVDSIAGHFITQEGKARQKLTEYKVADGRSPEAWKRHGDTMRQIAPMVVDIVERFRLDLNVVLARGVSRAFQIARAEYRRTLDRHGVLDFAELVERALALFGQMDEFARSRYLLEARYQHVLVDEFQDTSRPQWRLVHQLVRAWGEGAGLAAEGRLPPSIFIVGDVKQSIYAFRDADVSLFGHASRFIDSLRPGEQSKRSISRNFRSVPQLLAFVNDLFDAIERDRTDHPEAFVFADDDRFPVDELEADAAEALGIVAEEGVEGSVEGVASEIARLLESDTPIRDRDSLMRRPVRPGDIAILFRSRDSHRELEAALEARAIPTYVYKGLGFFDADEIKDSMALLRFLARPSSRLRAAAFLRSRFVRLSDDGLLRIGRDLALALTSSSVDERWGLDDEDASALGHARAGVVRWLAAVDHMPPADLFDAVLEETAYACEMSGPRLTQARENLKKMRGLIRRIQNRGYATLARIADHLDRLSAGDESNAAIDAVDAVSLMTVHAAKGLEFPVVFLVNLARGTGGRRPPIRVERLRGAGFDESVEDAEPGDVPSVTVADFQPDAEAERRREREETKRLLYVAMTRARDRLYLATALKDGRLQPGPGSLADVLPSGFRDLFNRVGAVTDGDISWSGDHGRRHVFRVCRPAVESPTPDRGRPGESRPDDFLALPVGEAMERLSVTTWVQVEPEVERPIERPAVQPGRPADTAAPVITGRLVHRMWQDRRHPSTHDLDQLSEWARSFIRPDELAMVADSAALSRTAARLWQAIRLRPEYEGLMARDCLFEVPFSFRSPGAPRAILRGVIDCLALSASGQVTVIELKTGQPNPSHQRQLDIYVEVARSLFPDREVRGVLI